MFRPSTVAPLKERLTSLLKELSSAKDTRDLEKFFEASEQFDTLKTDTESAKTSISENEREALQEFSDGLYVVELTFLTVIQEMCKTFEDRLKAHPSVRLVSDIPSLEETELKQAKEEYNERLHRVSDLKCTAFTK